MTRVKFVSASSALVCVIASVIQAQEVSVIPKPMKMELTDGTFEVQTSTTIRYETDAARAPAELLREFLQCATGFDLAVTKGRMTPGSITLRMADVGLGTEGYTVSVSGDGVLIAADSVNGLVYGVQTVRQLLPVQIFGPAVVQGVRWIMPGVRITDKPRYQWRGLHLDVCRHFVSKAFIKKFVDLLSMHKMNVFHWHLTEDQAWRIEIKKYPRLTEVGAWRPGTGFGLDPKSTTHYNDKGQYGGYYSQEDVREIVAYAGSRGVTIVPEIELPGHALAALTAYPQFGCTGGPYSIKMDAGISRDVYCPGKDETLVFLGHILDEVADLFPGTFFHVGGDECPKERWKACPACQKRIKDNNLHNEHELQSWVIKWAEKTLAKKGKRLIGWDEILEGGLAPNAAVMSWRGKDGGITAAKMGHDVVMSPTSHCYFDYKQAAHGEPKAMGRDVLDLHRVYSFEPTPTLPADKEKHVLGAQGNLWTEYMPNEAHVEYMAYPRACAMAEVTWSPKSQRNWEDFQKRLSMHYNRLTAYDVNARIPVDLTVSETEPGTAVIKANLAGATIHYTLDGTEASAKSPVYSQPIVVNKLTHLRTVAVTTAGKTSPEHVTVLRMPKASVTTSLPVYQHNSPQNVIDGNADSVFWSSRPPHPDDHLTLTFETPTAMTGVAVMTGKIGGGDELAQGTVDVSADGRTFTPVATFKNGMAHGSITGIVKTIRIKPTASQNSWLVVRNILLK